MSMQEPLKQCSHVLVETFANKEIKKAFGRARKLLRKKNFPQYFEDYLEYLAVF
jgi:hypothetical protein